MSHSIKNPTSARVIRLAERAREVIEITELEPGDGDVHRQTHQRDGSITQYPTVTWWRQSVARVPATIPHLFAYLREARKRNICLIRGAPANLERQQTRRQKAGIVGGKDRGDHGFIDEPTRLFFLDVDGVQDQLARRPGTRDPDHRRAAGRAVGLDVVRVVLLGDARARDVDERQATGPAGSSTASCACGSCSSPSGR